MSTAVLDFLGVRSVITELYHYITIPVFFKIKLYRCVKASMILQYILENYLFILRLLENIRRDYRHGYIIFIKNQLFLIYKFGISS